jgi:hypothetical protein
VIGNAGWLCDTWTEAEASATDVLLPRLYWLSKEDDKFHGVMPNVPVAGAATLTLGPIDPELEPRREAFMRVTLAQWENEYFTTQGVQFFPDKT